jgi:capsular exopolysaccharide synthesis family protein
MSNNTFMSTKPTPEAYHKDLAEPYRQLRTNLEFSAVASDLKVLVVSSADAAEGKTETAVNLAKVMAARKKRVLLIDADLRIPDLHKLFNISKRTGLSSALLEFGTDDFDRTKYIQYVKVPQGINPLAVMPAGPSVPNPAEILSSRRFAELLEHLRQHYDMIILDSAPIMPVADTIAVAQAADGLLFCVASEQTHKDRAKTALTTLQRTGIKVVGCVLTMVKRSNDPYDYYYYSYSQGAKKPQNLGQLMKTKRKKAQSPKNESE